MNKICKRIKSWIYVLYYFLISFSGSRANILSSEETVDEILKNKKSLIRLGDGEFGIFHGKSIHYQKCSKELMDEFIKMKNDYEKGECPYLIAVPKTFFEVSGFKLLKKRRYIASWSQSRADFMSDFSQNIVYGDAFLFKKSNNNIFSRIWNEDKKRNNIIFVHNDYIYSENFRKQYNKNVYFVKCPKQNSYESIDDIISEMKFIIKENNLNEKNSEIVVSCGPAGKVIVKRFSYEGFLSIDTGHCWDEPLHGLE